MTRFVLVLAALGAGTCRARECPWVEPWEWSGIFHKHEGGLLRWSAEKVAGAYPEPSMRLVIRSASSATEEALEAHHEAVGKSWQGAWIEAHPGDVLRPGGAYLLRFDPKAAASFFQIQVEPETNVAFFAEHLPTEFMDKFQFLAAEDGDEVPFAVEVSSSLCEAKESWDSSGSRLWEVVLASLISILPTLMGIFMLCLACKDVSSGWCSAILHFVNAGACGVMFAAAVFLLMPEASHLLNEGLSEVEASVTWGSCLLIGWLAGAFIHHTGELMNVAYASRAELPAQLQDDVTSNESTTKSRVPELCLHDEEAEAKVPSWVISLPVLLGDALHNLADGFVIGTAFKSCDKGFAWKIVGVTMAHEIPQELADFFLLVNKAGLSWGWATLLNFLSGLSTLLGAVVAFYLDVGSEMEGSVLAVGSGIFIYIAATELGPSVSRLRSQHSRPVLGSVATLLAFVLGATFIGLVLLDHQHCVPAAFALGGPGHDGHQGHAGHSHHGHAHR